MQTIKLQLEDELYDNIKEHKIDLQSKFKEFLSTLTDDGYPSISIDEAKLRVKESVEKYNNNSMETISHEDMWNSIDEDCKVKIENKV